MTDPHLLLIIDRLTALDSAVRLTKFDSADHADLDDLADLTDQLVYWVRRTAARVGRDLLTASPAERLNLPPGQFPAHTMLRVAESYADSFYPEQFDKCRDKLLDLEPGEARFTFLRGKFIEWLHKMWQEEAQVPLHHQVPPKASEEDNALLAFTPEQEPEERREARKENLRRLRDPLASWMERNQHLPLWQPACNLLRSTDGRLEIAPLQLDRQQLLVPSQAEIDDCWFRALWVIVCKKPEPAAKRSRALAIRELADIIGIDDDQHVDYLIRLEKEFQAVLRKS